MQLEMRNSRMNVVTFARGGGAALPERRCVSRLGAVPAPEFIRAALSRSERLSEPDPSGSAGTG